MASAGAFAQVAPAPANAGFRPASAAAASAPATTFATTSNTDYRIGANDLLDVDIPDLEKETRRTVRVNASGAISLPLIGYVTVGGLSAHQAEAAIAKRYSEKYLQNPQVSVFVKEFTTERITVEGAVAKPGMFPLTGQMTLLRALALAGGFGPIANQTEVMLFRVNAQKQREVAVFNIEEIRAGKTDDPQIKGDDLIVVQQDSTRRLLKDSVFRDIVDSINPFTIFAR
ncbi:MAG: polysaccharide biosynthesis/export family protein [Pseudomonadota bacterium]